MSKFVVFSVLFLVVSMYQPINSFGIVRVDIQQDRNTAALANAIGSAISQKIASWNSILSSLLQLKNSYKTVTYNVGTTSGSSGSASAIGSSSGSSSANAVYSVPLYRKTVHVNYGVAAPVTSNSIESSSDDDVTSSSSSQPTSSVGASGQTIFTANKIIGGVPAASVSASASTSAVSSGSASVGASVASPNSIGYSYRKTYG